MANLTRQQLIEQLEHEAEMLHGSTRVDIPLFSPLHNYLRSKSPIYYKWSISPKSTYIHIVAVLGFIVSIIIFLAVSIFTS